MSVFGNAGSPQSALSSYELYALTAYLTRNVAVFLEARRCIEVSHFSAVEVDCALCWQVVKDFHFEHGALPPRAVLRNEMLSRISGSKESALSANPVGYVDGLLNTIFDTSSDQEIGSSSHTSYGTSLLRKFANERIWTSSLVTAAQSAMTRGSNQVDSRAVLDEFTRKLSQVSGIGGNRSVPLLGEEGIQPQVHDAEPTGLDFLDRYMGGGPKRREVYGVLGCYGSGKTMLGCNIAAREASNCYVRQLQGSPGAISCYFSYETPIEDIRTRSLSYLSQIKLDHIIRGNLHQNLSRAGGRHPYEELLFPHDPRGELERLEDTRPLWNLYRMFDMTGPETAPQAGSGGIDEIQASLEREASTSGMRIDTVVIDYALICSRRFLSSQKGSATPEKLRLMLSSFGDQCRTKIAYHFNCKVWVFSQLSAESNRKPQGTIFTMADAAESKNFGENLWFCFVMGKPIKSQGTIVPFICDKFRRVEPNPHVSILRLRGDMARFADSEDTYVFDPARNRVRSREDLANLEAMPYRANSSQGSVDAIL